MNPNPTSLLGCSCCISRRRFLTASCGLCLGATTPGWLEPLAASDAKARPSTAAQGKNRSRVRLVFACWALKQDRPTWPRIGYEFSSHVEQVTATLKQLCPEVEFLPAVTHSPDDAKQLLASGETDRIDGYIVYQMNNWVQVMQTIVASGKPTLVADFIYAGSGGFLTYTAGLRRVHKTFSVVSSSNLEDLAAAARGFAALKQGQSAVAFAAAADEVRRHRTATPGSLSCQEDRLNLAATGQCLEAMKRSKIVAVGRVKQALDTQIAERLGIEVVSTDFSEIKAAYETADRAAAAELAARWQTAARAVTLENARETLESSALCYLAQRAVLARHQADAITINCLGGFYGGHLAAYPCLGFVELLNAGLIGACEADLNSTATMVAMKHLAHRPGYISDPVLDTAKRQIIYAHCVAPTKILGPAGPANPFEILSHAEDQKGASVRSFLPSGYMTSSMEISAAKSEILFHRARAMDNIVIDRACRTKLAAEVVGDMEKLFTFWDQYGWHRVTFYGDLREPVKDLAAALKFKFVEEA